MVKIIRRVMKVGNRFLAKATLEFCFFIGPRGAAKMADHDVHRACRLFDDKVVLEGGRDGSVVLRFDPSSPNQIDAQVIEPGAAEKASEGQVVTIDAVYGIFNLLSGPFIALVLESEAKMTGVENRPSAIQQMDFWKVSRVAIIPLFAQGLRLTPSQQRDEDRYLEMLHSAFSHHQLYFSHTYDVTLSFQKIGTMSDADRAKPLWQRANPRFFWNRELVDVLVRVR